MIRANQLQTMPSDFMLWDKDLGCFASKEDVKRFCSIEENIFGIDGEYRLQCLGRFKKLAYTGIDDCNKRHIYEGFIVKATYKISNRKIVTIGVIAFERTNFVIIDANGEVLALSAFEPNELKIIGNIFEHPEILKEVA